MKKEGSAFSFICSFVFGIFIFSTPAHASTLSGGNYTLNGGPTAISSAESSGGTYNEQSTADPASGNTSGGVYATTPAPAAPAQSSVTSQNTTPTLPSQNYSGGVSGQIVIEKFPSSTSTTNSSTSHGGGQSVSLTAVRIVRGTPTSITVHFTTSIAAIGSVRYSQIAGGVTLLSDSVPSIDHTFTITSLTPSLVYDLQLAAVSSSGASSGVYEVFVAPEQIGESGQSVSPALVPYKPVTAKPATTTEKTGSTSTSTSTPTLRLPTYTYGLLALILVIIIGIVWARRRRPL